MNSHILLKMETDDTTQWPGSNSQLRIADKVARGEYVLRTRNSNYRSKCWSIFSIMEDLNGEKVKGFVYCRVCKKVFCFHHTTSNLVRHSCYREAFKPKSPTIENETVTNDDVENFNNKLTKLITKWLIKYCRPYGLIEDDDLKAVFQEFVEFGAKFGTNVDIDKLLPSSTAVASNMNEMYEKCLKTVKEEIASIKNNGFGLVADSWTDIFSKKNYITLTMHFLKNGALKMRLLGLRSLQGEKFTSQNVHEAIETILNDFDCKFSNNTIIVTRNGANDFREVSVKYRHLSCITYLLNNALRKSIEDVAEVAELARACEKLVNFLKNSTLNASFSSLLQSFCPGRWNTMYNMLKSLENNWNEITNTLQEHNEEQRIAAINLIHLKAVNKTLLPFEEAIQNLEEENCSTLHLVLVYVHELRKSCDTNDSEFRDFDFIESLKEKLRFYLDDIVTENDTTLYKIALFLYPPTNKLLQFSDQEKQCIEDECIRLLKCYESETKPRIKQEPTAFTTPVCKRKKFFSDFVEPEMNKDPNELIKQELQCYKYMRVINSDEFDAFNWWDMQKDNFPLLHRLSCAVLATPASSSSAQRIVSAAGSLLCENMLDLGHCETKVEQIMFIHSNSEQDDLESEFELK